MNEPEITRTSARNKLPGTVIVIKKGDVMCQVDLQVGDNHVVAVITTEVYSVVVFMAVATTMVTPLLLKIAFREAKR